MIPAWHTRPLCLSRLQTEKRRGNLRLSKMFSILVVLVIVQQLFFFIFLFFAGSWDPYSNLRSRNILLPLVAILYYSFTSSFLYLGGGFLLWNNNNNNIIGVRAIFCRGGDHLPKKVSQVAQIFAKQSKSNEGHTMQKSLHMKWKSSYIWIYHMSS